MNTSIHIPGVSRSLLNHFGLGATGVHDSHKCKQVRDDLHFAVQSKAMTALIGPYQSGKTFLMRQVKRSASKNVIFVHVKAFEDKWIRIGSILTAIIQDTSTEGVRRDMETRSRQVIRILGNLVVNEGKQVCLVIEDCHRLHVNTLNTLKLMREADFAGYAPLFSVIMLGWPEFLDKLSNRRDILERITSMRLSQESGWFTYPERVQYLENVFGQAIEGETRKRIAQMEQTPGSMDHYVVEMMHKAHMAGFKIIDENVVQPTLKERYDRLKSIFANKISYAIIGDIAGLGKSTVSLAIESEPDTPATSKVSMALDQLEINLATHNKTEKRAS